MRYGPTMRSGVVAGLAALAIALAPATAGAYTFVEGGYEYTLTQQPITSPALEAGNRAAAEYWGAPTPTCGTGLVQWHELHVRVVGPTTGFPAGARATLGGCSRWIHPDLVRTSNARKLCRIVVHEIGHNHGHGHIDGPTGHDPHGVMSGAHDGGEPPQCVPPRVERRKYKRVGDRRWCRKRPKSCSRAYPKLARRVLRSSRAS